MSFPNVSRIHRQVGILRTAVAILVLICLPFVFFPGESDSGWRVIPVYIIPVMALMLIWILPFDILMSRVFMSGKEGTERDHYKTVIKFDALLLFLLFVFWGPFYAKLVTA